MKSRSKKRQKHSDSGTLNSNTSSPENVVQPRSTVETTPIIHHKFIPPVPSPSVYQKLPVNTKTYLAYVVAIRDPLNIHLDIYWPHHMRTRYKSALNYKYTFISEELDDSVYIRTTYCCHLKGVEIISKDNQDFANMKEAYILISKQILRAGGWILVSVSDIDIYKRVLVNIFDIVTRRSINHELLNKISNKTGEGIARRYSRPSKNRPIFQPGEGTPKDYHIIFKSNRT